MGQSSLNGLAVALACSAVLWALLIVAAWIIAGAVVG